VHQSAVQEPSLAPPEGYAIVFSVETGKFSFKMPSGSQVGYTFGTWREANDAAWDMKRVQDSMDDRGGLKGWRDVSSPQDAEEANAHRRKQCSTGAAFSKSNNAPRSESPAVRFPTDPQYHAYRDAMLHAERDGRPLLVLCCADYCTSCRALEHDGIHTKLAGYGHFVHLKDEHHRELINSLGVLVLPWLEIRWYHEHAWHRRYLCDAGQIRAYAEGRLKIDLGIHGLAKR
jgi:hypothetical protein